MPDPKDITATGVPSRLTFDKGLGFDQFAAEKIDYLYDARKNINGVFCSRFNLLPDSVLNLNTPQTIRQYRTELERQFIKLNYALVGLPSTSTSCLLQAAAAFHQLLLLFMEIQQTTKIISVGETLLGIFAEVEKRTRKPYQYKVVFNEREMFKPLPVKILTEFPLSQYPLWKRSSLLKKPAVAPANKKPVTGQGLIPIVEKKEKEVDPIDLQAALDAAEAANEKVKAELDNLPQSDTPEVNKYRENLKKLTLEDVYKQTKVSIRNHADFTLSSLVEVIYYASYVTLVLDKNGEPLDGNGIHGLFPYGMIRYAKKFKTVKFIPPPGRYISLGALADQQFSFKDATIQKLPVDYQGILGFQEVDVTGQWTPDYQEEANKRFAQNHEYIGSLIVETAFHPKDFNLSDIISTLPDIVDETMPYFYFVVKKKAGQWYDNFGDLLKEIAAEALKTILAEELKKVVRNYIIKKLGQKIIPIVNAIAAVKSAVNAVRGEFERELIAIQCVRLYLKGHLQDDRTLSVKILANILGDEFEDKIKEILLRLAVKAGVKLVNKVKQKAAKLPPAPLKPEPQKALPEPVTPPAETPAVPKRDEPGRGTNNQEEAWKVFQETRANNPVDKRGTDSKANNRPDDGKTDNSTTPPALPLTVQKVDQHNDTRKNTNSLKEPQEEDKTTVNRGLENDKENGKNSKKSSSQPEKEAENENVKGDKPQKPDKSGKGSKEEEEEENDSGKRRSDPSKPVKAYPPLEVFTHSTQRKFRSDLVNFFKNHPNHPLIALYNSATGKLQPSNKKGMDTFYWEEHPEAVQAGHVRSKHTGARDQIVIMTAAENQSYNHTIESRRRGSIEGGFKVAIIEGIPISVKSAQHMVQFGKLAPEALANAQIVDVDDL